MIIFRGNIPGNQLKSGEVICDYLQPFPMRGTGYHRCVFVLYKQDKKIDFSSLKKESPWYVLVLTYLDAYFAFQVNSDVYNQLFNLNIDSVFPFPFFKLFRFFHSKNI